MNDGEPQSDDDLAAAANTIAEEPDPEQTFRTQWLNQWPTTDDDAPTDR